MSSRRVTATPARNRPTIFSPQPQELPLNQPALNELDNLKKYEAARQREVLQKTLEKAAKLLADTVGRINDRAAEERERRQSRLQKLRRDGEEETEEDREEFSEYQEKVEKLTKTMDEGVRKVVDDQQFAEKSPAWIQHVISKSTEVHERNQRIDEEEEEEEEEEEQEDEEGNIIPRTQTRTRTQPLQPLEPSQESTTLLHAARSTAETEWNSQTLTEKYARNESYAEFYKTLWDAKNPGEQPPPLPHPSMWFAAQEGRAAGRNTQRSTQRSATDDAEAIDDTLPDADDEDTELQMTSDLRSVKCPLTMLYFKEPVTSTLCPHSFEKEAIVSFIRGSDKRLPLTAEQENELNSRHPRGSKGRPQAEAIMRSRAPKCAQCPVPGCTIKTLTENDFRVDNVLLRMTKRAQDAERREQEEDGNDPEELDDDDSDDDMLSATQRKKKKKVYPIGSSPMGTEARRRTLVKPERQISVVPNSQSQARSQTLSQQSQGRGGLIGDYDDDDDDDDAMEE